MYMTIKEILEQALSKIAEEHGVIISEIGVSYIDVSSPCAKESNYVVDDIRIKAVLK